MAAMEQTRGDSGRSNRSCSGQSAKEAFCTMITSDSFVLGVETMLYSLHRSMRKQKLSRTRDIVCLITSQVSPYMRKRIQQSPFCDIVKLVEPIANPTDKAKVHVKGWVNAGYTKLRIWTLVEYSKVVYIDADALIVAEGGVEDLFLRPGKPCPAAAPDVFPPDKFNAGVLVVEPSLEMFDNMMDAIGQSEFSSYDGGDTGFLNAFFPDWFKRGHHFRLPFCYNAQRTLHWMTYEKNPGYWNIVKPLKIIHFSSTPKPWESPDKKGELEMVWWNWHLQSIAAKSQNETAPVRAVEITAKVQSSKESGKADTTNAHARSSTKPLQSAVRKTEMKKEMEMEMEKEKEMEMEMEKEKEKEKEKEVGNDLYDRLASGECELSSILSLIGQARASSFSSRSKPQK